MPLGKGQRFASTTGPLVNRLISDWKIATIVTFASGQYYSPLFTGPDPANASLGFVTQLPDCVGNPNSGARTLSQWFNPAAFAIPPASAGRYGTCGMNTLEGYPIHIAHVSLSKTFAFTDTVKAVFTAQISNVTNTPHFTIPNNNLSTPNPGMFSSVFAGAEFDSGEVGQSTDRFEIAAGVVGETVISPQRRRDAEISAEKQMRESQNLRTRRPRRF